MIFLSTLVYGWMLLLKKVIELVMKQCLLKSGNRTTVGWVEDKYAVKGKKLSFDDADVGKCHFIWEVLEVFGYLPDKEVKARERDFAHHRETTDI